MDGWFVDCHCHISAEEFYQDIDDVIKRTKEAGVKTLISVTEKASEFERVIQLSKIYPGLVAPCLGIHPVQGSGSQDQHSVTMQDLEPALPLFQKYREDIVAVGEAHHQACETFFSQPPAVQVVGNRQLLLQLIGLDFTPWYAPHIQQREEQQAVFRKQLEIAKDLDLPVNVHSRSAAKVTIGILKEQGIGCALLHNFAGRLSVAMEGVQAGYYFSFPPAVCRNEQRARLIKQIPLEHICLETDSPALGPDKHVRNEPKNITLSCEYIAQVKGIPPERVTEATTQNAFKLFPKLMMTAPK